MLNAETYAFPFAVFLLIENCVHHGYATVSFSVCWEAFNKLSDFNKNDKKVDWKSSMELNLEEKTNILAEL